MKQIHVAGALAALALIAGAATPATAQVGRNQGILNPDLAGEAELRALPGLDSALVARILAERPFAGMAAFDALVAGALDSAQRVALYRRVFLPLNLNATTPEEILLVPGAGRRMAREFQEYRPYRTMNQFRREIGKYVDSTEVARLEQYVFVPIDLNTATDDDIQSIPGVGRRMLREFKEYRPYRSMEQFRREIGKYVNAREVARLEQYVEIRSQN
jgi:DNA uptake protein ComE-like DNA-binding protein